MVNDVKVRPFSPEEYETYKEIKPILQSLYPWIFNSSKPLPIHPDVFKKILDDPYLRYTDEQLNSFGVMWQIRREYTAAVCAHQVYFNEKGGIVCDIPLEVIASRARAMTRYIQGIRFDLNKKDPNKIV